VVVVSEGVTHQWYERAEARAVLTARDVGAVYRLLQREGVTQREAAEPLAAASVRRWEDVSQVGHAQSGIVLATVHVLAGERDGLPMAHTAITTVSRLSSTRARRRLQPLATALADRPGRDAQDFTRLAQHTISAGA
jgi:hypothetical protein